MKVPRIKLVMQWIKATHVGFASESRSGVTATIAAGWMLILDISSRSRQMVSPTKKANSSQAQPHAIIEHRQRHIVMNHGSLLKVFLRRGFNPFPIQSVSLASMQVTRKYLRRWLPSKIGCMDQVLDESMLESSFSCSDLEKLNRPVYSLLVES